MSLLNVRVVTPDKVIYEGTASAIHATGIDGHFTILPRHLPMVSFLGLGELRLDTETGVRYIAIDGGALEVSDNQVIILANEALAAEDVDVARLKMELERAERLKQNIKNRDEMIRQELEITKLINTLKVGQHLKK